MDARREDVLDAPYFHVVFTVPDILNPVIYSNQKLLYDTLYHAASDTIRELSADTEHLGAKVGYICILHTWGSEMNFHPHIHTILLGGGLTPENKWKDNGEDFFLPVSVISRMFRGKYMEELKQLWKSEIPDACTTQTFCKDPALWAFMLQDKEETAHSLPESSGVQEVSFKATRYENAGYP